MAVFMFGRSGGDSLSPVFSENSWEQIIEACQRNKVPETWVIGDQKAMLINGTNYAIDIIGKYHDTYSDGTGKAPLTLQLRDCYATKCPMDSLESAYVGWAESEMRRVHLPNILSLMPNEVQLGVRNVNKLTEAKDDIALETTADKLFLLSEEEIFGKTIYTNSGEGVQYDYYKNGGSKDKKFVGDSDEWWTRSLFGANSDIFVTVSGGTARLVAQDLATAVSPAFCF